LLAALSELSARSSYHRPSRNARTSRSNAFGLSTLEACDASGITTRHESLSALPSPSRMWWKDAGDRSPAIRSVGALIASASARANGARCSVIWPSKVAALSRHLPSVFWRPVPTARPGDHVNCGLKTLVDLAAPNSFGRLCVERAQRNRRRSRRKPGLEIRRQHASGLKKDQRANKSG
jgi:hypothetical protein